MDQPNNIHFCILDHKIYSDRMKHLAYGNCKYGSRVLFTSLESKILWPCVGKASETANLYSVCFIYCIH